MHFNWPFAFHCGRFRLISYFSLVSSCLALSCLDPWLLSVLNRLSNGASILLVFKPDFVLQLLCLVHCGRFHEPGSMQRKPRAPWATVARRKRRCFTLGLSTRVTCTVLQASRRAVWTTPAKTYREHVHAACNSLDAPWGSLSPLSMFRNTG